jgi:DNA-binding NarL/FixJ family response regulator
MRLADSVWSPNKGPGEGPLTPAEEKVIGCLLRGFANKDISAELGITVVTVKSHMRNICDKLGVRTRLEIALLASKDGFAADILRSRREWSEAKKRVTRSG